MALNDLHVDSIQSDNNGGTTEGAAVVSGTAASTNSTVTVTLDGGSDLSSVVVGDAIRIAGETGGVNGTDIFEITSIKDGADTVDVTPTPGTASGLTWAIGGAWATGDRAMNVVSAGDKVFVKDTANYNETWNIDQAGTRFLPIEFEGYTTTKGDNGRATIDGQSTRANGIANGTIPAVTQAQYVFKNFRITGHTSHGVDLSTNNNDVTSWHNCRFDNNGGHGVFVDDFTIIFNCQADNNTDNGIRTDAIGAVVKSKSFSNGGIGIRSDMPILFCLVYDNAGAEQINHAAANIVANCTVDGNKASNPGTDGINFSASGTLNVATCINNIITRCDIGLEAGTTTTGENRVNANNLFFDNTTDVVTANFPVTDDAVFADPKFVDQAGADYRLKANSPALAAGADMGSPSFVDIGAIQSDANKLVHSGMTGGMRG